MDTDYCRLASLLAGWQNSWLDVACSQCSRLQLKPYAQAASSWRRETRCIYCSGYLLVVFGQNPGCCWCCRFKSKGLLCSALTPRNICCLLAALRSPNVLILLGNRKRVSSSFAKLVSLPACCFAAAARTNTATGNG